MHQTAIKPQTKLETLRSIYTLVFQKRLTTTNDVVHSSKFNIESNGVEIGAYFFTYMAYYLILLKAEYTREEATSILKKLFRFNT